MSGKATHADGPAQAQGSGAVIWGLAGLVLAVVVGIGGLALWGGGLAGLAPREMLRPIGEVPDFALLERSGQQVTKADLLGKVWIVNFVFTQCVEACPLSSSRMVRLQQVFAAEDRVRLVSITVDPIRDTPEVLTAYATQLRAHPQRWLFLTGDKASIYRLARKGFYLGVIDARDASQTSWRQFVPRIWQVVDDVRWLVEPAIALAHHGQHRQGEDGQQAIQHSGRLVLVDRQGYIRQYYDSKDNDAVQRLQRHVKLLLREPS